jgi:hypothetical protein
MSNFKRDALGWWIAMDPQAMKDFTLDWSAFLAAGESIASSIWQVGPGLSTSAPSDNGSAATVWLTPDPDTEEVAVCWVRNRITTSAGRADRRSFRIVVKTQ